MTAARERPASDVACGINAVHGSPAVPVDTDATRAFQASCLCQFGGGLCAHAHDHEVSLHRLPVAAAHAQHVGSRLDLVYSGPQANLNTP